MNRAIFASAFALCTVAAVLTSAAGARAAERKSNVITLGEIQIVGRVQKPIESVDVGLIAPKLSLSQLRQPFLDRIEEAVRKDPF
jgi:hypothetical protein